MTITERFAVHCVVVVVCFLGNTPRALEVGGVVLEASASSGTQISLNHETLGLIAGQDFNQAVLSIWLGSRPVSKQLKQSILAGK